MIKLKTPIIFLFFLQYSVSCFSQNNYNITFNLKGAAKHKIYLLNIYGGLHNRANTVPLDSISPQRDTFSFTGNFDETKFYSLAIDTSSVFCPFIIDTGSIIIKGDVDNFPKITLKNSWQNDKLNEFGINTDPLINTMNSFGSNGNMKQYDSVCNIFLDSILVFMKRYPNSYGIFNTASHFMVDEERFKVFGEKYYPLISDQLKSSEVGKQMAYVLYNYSVDSIVGKKFPLIKAFDIKKKHQQVTLDPKSIYLIDYWASWCIPCVEKLPALKNIYSKYQKKGFKIISLSIDEDYTAWLKALKKHEIIWENYCTLNGTHTDDARYFNITSIPYTVLVGKGNRIIKLNPTEKEIEEYLETQ